MPSASAITTAAHYGETLIDTCLFNLSGVPPYHALKIGLTEWRNPEQRLACPPLVWRKGPGPGFEWRLEPPRRPRATGNAP